jgi:hypothetical protein
MSEDIDANATSGRELQNERLKATKCHSHHSRGDSSKTIKGTPVPPQDEEEDDDHVPFMRKNRVKKNSRSMARALC